MRFEHFEFYNPNPKEIETGDCVIRALAKAVNKTWYEVYDELYMIGRELCVMPNNDEAFKEMLKRYGFVRKTMPKLKRGEKSINSEKFCKLHPAGTYILRTAHHIQTVKDGKFFDLTPSLGDKMIYSYYEKEI